MSNENKNEYEGAYIISDKSGKPKADSPDFGFELYAKTIADLIARKDNETPLVIGIYGSWGSGKTTLMEMIKDELAGYKNNTTQRVCKPVWFQAWKYAEEDAILAALIEEIFRTMEQDGFFNKTKGELEKLGKRLDKRKVLSALSKAISGGMFDVTEFFGKLEHTDKLGFYSTFDLLFEDLIWAYVRNRPKLEKRSSPDDKKGALVVFIDDLDRCPRDRVLKVLETIKLFMDKEGCVFVIGAAKEVIEDAIRQEREHGKVHAEKFMDKIVQVTFNLPKAREEDIGAFVKFLGGAGIQEKYLPLITRSTEHNPRSIKRFLNNLSLRRSLARNQGLTLGENDLALWSLLEQGFYGLVKQVIANPKTIEVMQNSIEELKLKDRVLEDKQINEEELMKVPESLRGYVQDRNAIELIEGLPKDIKEIETLISLSSVTESVIKEEPESTSKPKLDAIATVPKGSFVYQDGKETIDYDYKIDVYLVTNERYRRFIEEGGYDIEEVWSSDGWKWKEKGNITQPGYWDDVKRNQPDHPVVGVSWHEAEAFSKWKGKRLPTELEWEKAARGEDGREYPWGNEFDKEKCNSGKSRIGTTTPVTRYVNGLSPYGCYDMAGNVWEWQSDWYDKKKTYKVLRGGSWSVSPENVRSAGRGYGHPYARYDGIGFRCAQ